MSYPEDLAYPEARHHGDRGEVNAALRPAGTPPEITSPGGGATHYLATHASAGGEFGPRLGVRKLERSCIPAAPCRR